CPAYERRSFRWQCVACLKRLEKGTFGWPRNGEGGRTPCHHFTTSFGDPGTALVRRPHCQSIVGFCTSSCRRNTYPRYDTAAVASATVAMRSGEIKSLVLQTDEKMLIGGDFLSVTGVARIRMAGLTSDGRLGASVG